MSDDTTRQVEVEPGETVEITAKSEDDKEDEAEVKQLFKKAMEGANLVSASDFNIANTKEEGRRRERIEVEADPGTNMTGFGRQLLKHGLIVSSVKEDKFYVCKPERHGYKVIDE
jgi:type II secretory ATPase GspE/PulE/Tfp pilus assembly ATPase PilB-like protein